jgi:glycosyltransferase involved in cell wall biosynthesis
MKTITAAIPCRNAEPYLAEAIESILKQTRPVEHIIVVDDKSTDGSAQIAQQYPVLLLRTPDNRSGQAVARNLAIEQAASEYIAWLDADDYWNANHCEVVAGLLDQNPDAALAFSAVRRFGNKNEVWDSSRHCKDRKTTFLNCFKANIVPMMSVVTRKSALLEMGCFNEGDRFAEDYDLFLRLAYRYAIVATSQVTSNWRSHPTSITSNHNDKQILWGYEARMRLIQELREDDEEQLADELSALMFSIWENDLQVYWRLRELTTLRMLLSLAERMPRVSPLAKKLRMRSYFPSSILHLWDRVSGSPAPART